MARFILRPRHRVVLRALGDALFAHDDGPRRGPARRPRRTDSRAHLTPVSLRPSRFGLLAARSHPVAAAAAARGVRPFDDLPAERRVRILERMERSRAAPLLLPLVAYKTLLSLLFFEDPTSSGRWGTPATERKRWLKRRRAAVVRGRDAAAPLSLYGRRRRRRLGRGRRRRGARARARRAQRRRPRRGRLGAVRRVRPADAGRDDAALLARGRALGGGRRSARRRSSACSRAGASAARACSPAASASASPTTCSTTGRAISACAR